MIRFAQPEDAGQIADIYNHYIRHTVITFETEPVSSAEMAGRIADVAANGLPWLVAEEAQRIIGYAYATQWRSRAAYRNSVEATVYLHKVAHGRGLGSSLYRTLFEQLQQRAIHTVICGIALPNTASVALHEKFGMEKVAHFKEVGNKFDRWIDVGYWQGLLENRPP